MQTIIQITKDEKKAFLTIITGENGNSELLTVDELKGALALKGVIKGVKEENLEQICRNKIVNKKVLAAEALSPRRGENGKIQIKIKPKERSTYDKGVDAEKRVDHYGERDGFITYVNEDDVIATRIPPTTGESGYSVTGREIKGISGRDIEWRNYEGRNTRKVGNDLIAVTSGILIKEESKFTIEQAITLEGDLGIQTGSIILPLEADVEVIVPGDIKGGFTVQCRKITVMGNVEDAKIDAKYLVVHRGIVGTSNKEIAADYLTTGFIIGTRIIRSKFLEVKKEISGGSTIYADFVHADVIQECSITARYGVWTKYLYGKNNICVGVDVNEQTEYNKWIEQLDNVDRALLQIKESNKSLLRKSETIKDMAKRKPKNPAVKKELEKVMFVEDKINKIGKITEALKRKIQLHQDNMYVAGSSFILVEQGFMKKEENKDDIKPVNDLTIKEFSYERTKELITGLYILKGEEVVVDSQYNTREICEMIENYRTISIN